MLIIAHTDRGTFYVLNKCALADGVRHRKPHKVRHKSKQRSLSPPPPAVVRPGDVRVDVGAAALAAHDARGAEVHHLDLCGSAMRG
jgi:hypothetical protein